MSLEVILAFFVGIAVGFMACFIYIRYLLGTILKSSKKRRDPADWWKGDDYESEEGGSDGEAWR